MICCLSLAGLGACFMADLAGRAVVLAVRLAGLSGAGRDASLTGLAGPWPPSLCAGTGWQPLRPFVAWCCCVWRAKVRLKVLPASYVAGGRGARGRGGGRRLPEAVLVDCQICEGSPPRVACEGLRVSAHSTQALVLWGAQTGGRVAMHDSTYRPLAVGAHAMPYMPAADGCCGW